MSGEKESYSVVGGPVFVDPPVAGSMIREKAKEEDNRSIYLAAVGGREYEVKEEGSDVLRGAAEVLRERNDECREVTTKMEQVKEERL